MQSRKFKYAKIGVLGGPKDALHGIRNLTLYLFLIIALSGCTWFADNRIIVKPEPPVDNRDRWKALAPFVKKHFETDMTVEEISAELAYQEYLLNNKSDPF